MIRRGARRAGWAESAGIGEDGWAMNASRDDLPNLPPIPGNERPAASPHASEVGPPRSAGSPRSPLRVVLARHEGAPTGDHLDLFVGADPGDGAAPDPDAPIARTWRLATEVWQGGTFVRGTHDAERLAPHRALYLALDAPRELDGGRGRVVPLAACRATGAIDADRIELHLPDRVLTLVSMNGSRWQLEVAERADRMHAGDPPAGHAGAGA